MKIAVLTDIHANQEALESVLDDADLHGAERFWFLGDVLGYGPDPHVSLLWLKEWVQPGDWVLGNHDALYVGLMPDDEVSPNALRALELNRQRLAEPEYADAAAFCQAEFQLARSLPALHSLEGADYWLVHSSQKDPLGKRRYVYGWHAEILLPDEFDALQRLALASDQACTQFYGHTHVPTLVFAQPQEEGFALQTVRVEPGETYALAAGLAIVNPGSVGFPRDLDNRAAYVLLDTAERTVTFRRVEYPWYETTRKLSRYGYPDLLQLRLRSADVASDTPQDWVEHFRRASEKAREG